MRSATHTSPETLCAYMLLHRRAIEYVRHTDALQSVNAMLSVISEANAADGIIGSC